MTKVHIPHRIPAEARLARLVNAGMADKSDVDAFILKHHVGGVVDMEAVVDDVLDGRDPPWTEHISGTLQLALEDDNGEPTGEIAEIVIVDGIAEIPDEHLAHTLAGVTGSRIVEDG